MLFRSCESSLAKSTGEGRSARVLLLVAKDDMLVRAGVLKASLPNTNTTVLPPWQRGDLSCSLWKVSPGSNRSNHPVEESFGLFDALYFAKFFAFVFDADVALVSRVDYDLHHAIEVGVDFVSFRIEVVSFRGDSLG